MSHTSISPSVLGTIRSSTMDIPSTAVALNRPVATRSSAQWPAMFPTKMSNSSALLNSFAFAMLDLFAFQTSKHLLITDTIIVIIDVPVFQ